MSFAWVSAPENNDSGTKLRSQIGSASLTVGSMDREPGGSAMRQHFLAVILAVAILLSGCTSTLQINALDYLAKEQDQLPADITIWPEDDIPASSVRFLVEHNEISYFGARSADQRRACIAAIPKESQVRWVAGCSDIRDDREIVHVSGTGVAEMVLVSDAYDVDKLIGDGWKPIHKNVVIAAP